MRPYAAGGQGPLPIPIGYTWTHQEGEPRAVLGSGFKAESGRERIHMAAGELVPWSGLPEKGPQGEKDKPYGRR